MTRSGANLGSAEMRKKLKHTSYQKRPAIYSKHRGCFKSSSIPPNTYGNGSCLRGALSSFKSIHAALAVLKEGPENVSYSWGTIKSI